MPYPSKISPEAIRRAAVSLLERKGEAGLSVRAVASALGVVPNALYHHYAGRDALLAAVADEGARRVLVAVRRAVSAVEATEPKPGPHQAATVRAVAEAYLRFARTHHAVYDVFMRWHEALERDDRQPLAHDELWATFVELVTPLVSEETAPVASVALWGFLHGMVGLERANLLGGAKPLDAAPFGLRALLAGLPLAASVDTPAESTTVRSARRS